MFQNITLSAAGSSASIEIFIMLVGSFLLWVLYSYLSQTNTREVIDDQKEKQNISKKAVKVPPVIAPKQWDDLQLIEWIGPAIEKLMHKNDIYTYKQIISLDIAGLEELLENAWWRYATQNPTTWPDQADLAKRKKWSELEEYQDILKQSKKKSS